LPPLATRPLIFSLSCYTHGYDRGYRGETEGGPKILEFDRQLCPVGKESERVILAVRDRYPGQFAVEKLYIDEAEAVFRRYKVAFGPTQVFLDAAGREVARHEGIYKEEALIQKLRELKFISD